MSEQIKSLISSTLCWLSSATLVAGCALNPNGDQQYVRIAVPQATQSSSSMNLSSAFSLTGSSRSMMTAPTTMDGFNCFGINVIAADIPQDNSIAQGCTPSAGMLYPGLVQGLVSATDGFIDAVVPGGAARTFQLFGVQMPTSACPRIQDLVTATNSGGGDPYDLGRATADVFGDTSVTIKEAYNTANPQKAFCTGGGGTAQPYAIRIKPSNPTGAPDVIENMVCTPMYLVAQDSAGNPYNLPAGSSLTVTMSSTQSTLYSHNPATPCTTPDQLPNPNGTITIPSGQNSVLFDFKGSSIDVTAVISFTTTATGWPVQQGYSPFLTAMGTYKLSPASAPSLNTCVPFTVAATAGGSTVNGTGVSRSVMIQASAPNGAVPAVSYYTASGCTGSPFGTGLQASQIPTWTTTSVPDQTTIYVKVTSTGTVNFSVYDRSGQSPANLFGGSSYSYTY